MTRIYALNFMLATSGLGCALIARQSRKDYDKCIIERDTAKQLHNLIGIQENAIGFGCVLDLRYANFTTKKKLYVCK